jgi:CHAD domain-containing protein
MPSTREQLEKVARDVAEKAQETEGKLAIAAAGTAATVAAGAGLRKALSRADEDDALAGPSSYRLLDEEPVGAGIKRIVLARVDDALAELHGENGGEPADAIHEARKDIKKTRSAIRLVRDQLGDDLYRRENQHYRGIGRGLSDSRDAEVLVETLDLLCERFGEPVRERYGPLRAHFEQQLQSIREDGSEQRAMAAACSALGEGRGRIETWSLDGDGWQLIGPGLHRTYRRGRKRLRDVEEEPSVTNLHEWRKRVKDLWYQLRLIRNAEPELIGHQIRDADDLADHLGDDHDLGLLREASAKWPQGFESAADQRLLSELIDRRRGELRFAATSLGGRVYREKPKRYVKALEQRFRAGRQREPV